MKRGKDDEKIMGPMFPKLHVNDTDKGGPKAPPRNKMALYEQLSVPSQRFSNQVTPSIKGSGNERGNFFSYQLPNRHQSEKQYGQYSNLTTPSTQVEQRKRSDEDDFTVPIFVHPVANQECVGDTNNRPLKFQKPKNTENNTRQEGLNKQTDSSIDRLRTCDSEEPAASGENIITDKSNSCIPSENQNLSIDDVRNEKGSREDRSCRSLQRGHSVSETSVVDSISRVDMTPDDVVGILGHRRFWKARRAIVNQQRVFAVQIFELHRLVKVQRLIASSPHLMLEDSTYLTKQVKSIPTKKLLPSTHPIKPIPNISKPKPEPQEPSHKKESSAEITSFSSIQNCVPPAWGFNPPPPGPAGHHQWLIPVMSPSEGLVYKPYPFVGPTGPNPTMNSFLDPPAYGVPPPPYQIPSFPPPPGPHGYFPPYMPPAFSGSSVEQKSGPTIAARIPDADVCIPRQRVMNPPAFSVSSVEQVNGPPVPTRIPDADVRVAYQHAMSSDVEVQGSTANSIIERQEDSNAVEERSVLPLFPMCPDVGPAYPISKANPGPEPELELEPEPEQMARVIKVVPHNARLATESAARIFRSIQEERRQFESG